MSLCIHILKKIITYRDNYLFFKDSNFISLYNYILKNIVTYIKNNSLFLKELSN